VGFVSKIFKYFQTRQAFLTFIYRVMCN